jgi:hypothetical protein
MIMIEQLKTEIKSHRKFLTLIMLILPYSLFITMGLIFEYAFLAIFIGMVITFIFFVIGSMISSSTISKKYKDLVPENIKINIERSYSTKTISLYLLLHTTAVTILFFIATFDVLSIFAAIFSLVFIGLPILFINSKLDDEIFKPHFRNMQRINDEYIFSANLEDSRKDVDNTWYSDPCLPGNPIYINDK